MRSAFDAMYATGALAPMNPGKSSTIPSARKGNTRGLVGEADFDTVSVQSQDDTKSITSAFSLAAKLV